MIEQEHTTPKAILNLSKLLEIVGVRWHWPLPVVLLAHDIQQLSPQRKLRQATPLHQTSLPPRTSDFHQLKHPTADLLEFVVPPFPSRTNSMVPLRI